MKWTILCLLMVTVDMKYDNHRSPGNVPSDQLNDGKTRVEAAPVRRKRKAVTTSRDLWPNASLIYTLTDEVVADKKISSAIQEAIEEWHSTTCIRFHRENETDLQQTGYAQTQKYVRFIKGVGCHSTVGMQRGFGPQNLSVGRACAFPEMVTHEIGHLIGLWHEHARWDRDNNVIILWNNVRPRAVHNFDKVPRMDLLTPYDVSSMMHYGMKMFSMSDQRTIKPVDERLSFLIGYRRDLSFYDILTVNKLYKCSAHCPSNSPRCENEGFLTHKCNCHCPRGLIGTYCHLPRTKTGCGGMVFVYGDTEFSSPGYPNGYPDKADCTWLLRSPEGTVIELLFDEFDVESTKFGTCRDRLEIRYHHIGISRGPSFCGKDFNGTITSIANKMLLHFKTNSRISKRGFHVVAKMKPRIDCSSRPCQNGGVCRTTENIHTHFCHCQEGWVGKNCEIPLVHGILSAWTSWSSCKAACGAQTRKRRCDNPPPQNGGRNCVGQTYQSRRCGDRTMCKGYFQCGFGAAPHPDDCGVIQDHNLRDDDLDWAILNGPTPSRNTGPTVGHSTGRKQDMYIYLEASVGRDYDKAIFWLPRTQWQFGLYCLQFFYHMKGRHMGTLRALRKYADNTETYLWQRSGNAGPDWQEANINVLLYDHVKLGFQGIRGSAYDSDLALDDISLSPGVCFEKVTQYGCARGDKQYVAGPFSYEEKCTRYHCFCNHDGKTDCPEWRHEDLCTDEEESASAARHRKIFRRPIHRRRIWPLNRQILG